MLLLHVLPHSGKLTDDEIKIILKNFFSHGMGSSGPDEYFDRIVNKAHESINGPKNQSFTTSEHRNLHSIKDLSDKFILELTKRRNSNNEKQSSLYGINTGFPLLNEILGGIKEQRLISLVGDTGSGKTAYCLQLAAQAAKNERAGCLYINYDMSFFSMNLMLFSRLSGVPHTTIANGVFQDKHLEKLNRIVKSDFEEWGSHLLLVEGDSTLSLNTLQALCAELKPKLLIVDSINRIPLGRSQYADNCTRTNETLSVLMRMAIELNIGIIAIASLERRIKSHRFLCRRRNFAYQEADKRFFPGLY